MLAQAMCVFAGAGCGAILRWRIGVWTSHLWPAFPIGTLVANLAGCLLVGLAAGCFEARPEIPQTTRLLVITGFLGGFTTFSAFSLETVDMLQNRPLGAFVLVACKLVACLALTYVGMIAARRIF